MEFTATIAGLNFRAICDNVSIKTEDPREEVQDETGAAAMPANATVPHYDPRPKSVLLECRHNKEEIADSVSDALYAAAKAQETHKVRVEVEHNIGVTFKGRMVFYAFRQESLHFIELADVEISQ